ncbi:hypothetical protein BLA60_33630 [Actinophytocola xinjiangensis]|uniref:Cytochrome P450 n=1 Tax=Actinophytocola xinjiangensis TaxID=485602 RepID=A0A7Z0WH13_9PSEU|nr:cytochrome P450 [Actinophytocola xinjiangensis]OLF06063.1 hypothetical protein BLA60_33630 [Actinophytocola xinjiangensis]
MSFAPVPSGVTAKPIPGERGLPVLGVSGKMMRDPLGLRQEQYERHGPVNWFQAFGMRQVGLLGPDAAELVAINRDKAFGQGWEPILGTFFPKGVLLLDFEEHLHRRRLMQNTFSPERLGGYLRRMQTGITRDVRGWRPGARFLAREAVHDTLLNVSTGTFLDIGNPGDAARVGEAFVNTVRGPYTMMRLPLPGTQWSKALRGRRLLEEYTASQIPAKHAGDGDDVFSALCHSRDEQGHGLSEEDLVNQIIFLMMAAHETTTSALSSMIYFLGRHPEWQDRLREESLSLDEQLDLKDLDQLATCDMVMKESVRRFPPISELARRTVKDTEVHGHFIPAGTAVSVSVLFNHHMEEYWPDPMTWDPGRFAADRREDKSHRFAWTPFGGGVHKCIGLHFASLQIKAVMHQLVRNFSWRLPEGYRLRTDWSGPPAPKDGLPVVLSRIG